MKGLRGLVLGGIQAGAFWVVVATLTSGGAGPGDKAMALATARVKPAPVSSWEAAATKPERCEGAAPVLAARANPPAQEAPPPSPPAAEPEKPAERPRIAVGFDPPRPANTKPDAEPARSPADGDIAIEAPREEDGNAHARPPILAMPEWPRPAPFAMPREPSQLMVAAYWRHDVLRFRILVQTGMTELGLRRVFGKRYEPVRWAALRGDDIRHLPAPPDRYVQALLGDGGAMGGGADLPPPAPVPEVQHGVQAPPPSPIPILRPRSANARGWLGR